MTQCTLLEMKLQHQSLKITQAARSASVVLVTFRRSKCVPTMSSALPLVGLKEWVSLAITDKHGKESSPWPVTRHATHLGQLGWLFHSHATVQLQHGPEQTDTRVRVAKTSSPSKPVTQ
jgi:hypothetical protein